MEDIEIGISRPLGPAGRDMVRAATGAGKSGEVSYVLKDGRRVAAIVPLALVEYALRHGYGR